LGYRVWGLGFRVWVKGLCFRVYGFRESSLRITVYDVRRFTVYIL